MPTFGASLIHMKAALLIVFLGPFILSCQRIRTDDTETGSAVATQTTVRDTMKVFFERTGGFAGMTVNVEIDADSLAENERRTLASLVSNAKFFSLPAKIASETPSRGADQFNYRITIDANGQRHTVETSDGSAPATLIPLLDWLNGAARRSRGS